MGIISKLIQTKAIIVKLTQVYTNNIFFTLKIRPFCIKVLIIPIFYAIFFYLYKIFFLTFGVFLYMIMDSLNTYNRSKPLAFKRFKHLLYKYYPKFFKTFKKHPNNFDRRQFFVILYDCVPNIKYQWSIDKLLKKKLCFASRNK